MRSMPNPEKKRSGGRFMKATFFFSLGLALVLLMPEASARGRYTRGKTVYQRKCAPCFSTGWKWSPRRVPDYKKLKLRHKARRWSTAKVCTWMRKSAKKRKAKKCYPHKMSYREKLNALYFVSRRARGAIRKPRLRKRTPKLYRGSRFKLRAKYRRAAALKRLRQLELLRKARQRGRASGRMGRYVKTKPVPKRKPRRRTRR
jgi:hypothetical protein